MVRSPIEMKGLSMSCGKGLGVTLHVTHFDTVTYASRHHVSIEMAAREMRYDWFEQLRKERGMAVIAVAHHRDDSVETFLLNLIRGAGINGLKGISPHNGCIVRPLLEVSVRIFWIICVVCVKVMLQTVPICKMNICVIKSV